MREKQAFISQYQDHHQLFIDNKKKHEQSLHVSIDNQFIIRAFDIEQIIDDFYAPYESSVNRLKRLDIIESFLIDKKEFIESEPLKSSKTHQGAEERNLKVFLSSIGYPYLLCSMKYPRHEPINYAYIDYNVYGYCKSLYSTNRSFGFLKVNPIEMTKPNQPGYYQLTVYFDELYAMREKLKQNLEDVIKDTYTDSAYELLEKQLHDAAHMNQLIYSLFDQIQLYHQSYPQLSFIRQDKHIKGIY